MCEIQTGWDGGQQERKKKKKERNGNAHTSFDNLRRQEQTAVYPEIRVDDERFGESRWSQTADDLRREEPKGTASTASTLTVVVLVRRQGRGFDEQPPRQCANQADLAVWEDLVRTNKFSTYKLLIKQRNGSQNGHGGRIAIFFCRNLTSPRPPWTWAP